MSAEPLVSVVVTTFNRRDLLRETLDAILGQSYGRLEVVVVDNESSDGTEAIVRGIGDDRIRYFRHANGGVIAVNRNFGIEQAIGDYIAFCDDDDIWLPQKIARQLEEMRRHPTASVVGTNAFLYDGKRRFGLALRHLPFKSISRHYLVFSGNPVALSSVLARASALAKAGGFRYDPAIVGVEDYDLWLGIALAGGEIRVLSRPLFLYRVHPGQASSRDRRTTIDKMRTSLERRREMGELGTAPFFLAMVNHRCRYAWAILREGLKRSAAARKWVYAIREALSKSTL